MLPGSGYLISQLRPDFAWLGDRTGAENLIVTNRANTRKLLARCAIEADTAIALRVRSRRVTSRAGVESQWRRGARARLVLCGVLFRDLVRKTEGAHRIAIVQTVIQQGANILRIVIEFEGDTDTRSYFLVALAVRDTIQVEARSCSAECVILVALHEWSLLRPRAPRGSQHAEHTKRDYPATPADPAGR